MTQLPYELEPVGKTIVTARRELMDHRIEPALDVKPALPTDRDLIGSETTPFLIMDSDPNYNNRVVGQLVLERYKSDPDHLKLFIDRDIAIAEPHVVQDAVEGTLEAIEEEGQVVIDPDETNLTIEELRQIGAVPLPSGIFEIQYQT